MRWTPAITGMLLLLLTPLLRAETGVYGTVRDSGGQVLPGVEVQVQSEITGARWKSPTDERGAYAFPALAAGRYKVTVRLAGFRTVTHSGIDLAAGPAHVDFTLELLELHEVITVVSGKEALDPTSGDSMLMTRGSPGATLPTNGRDYRAAFDLMPGVVVTPAASSDAGQFTSNGQRPNANGFRVDGISANTGVGGSILPGSFPGASLPAMSAVGSTETLGVAESAQSVELRTANFAPEWGGRPGAQALIVTRTGASEFHGELFGHIRDNNWSARDWFLNRDGLALQRPSYSSLGGILSGPIRRNRTYFFASIEQSKLSDSAYQLIAVPSLTARQNAPDRLKPILDYFPQPGPDLGNGEAESIWQNGTSATLRSWSARVDHAVGSRANLFARVVGSPSSSSHSQDSFAIGNFNWLSVTAGATFTASGAIHDLRLNYSRAGISSSFIPSQSATAVLVGSGLLPGDFITTPYGNGLTYGQIPPELTALLPASAPVSQTVLGLSVPGIGQFVSSPYGNGRQDQWEARDTFSRHFGKHDLRAGGDYILLQPTRDNGINSVLGSAASLQSLLNGDPLAVTYSVVTPYGGRVHAVSLFAQDTWRLSDRLSLMYGLRWEVTPPIVNQVQIPTVSGLWTGSQWQTTHSGDINGAAPWPMRYGQVAPRLGLAWRLPTAGLVLRAGAGLFYDATLGSVINPINGAPFNSWLVAGGGPGINGATGSSANPASGPPTPDVENFLLGQQAPLRLPSSYQWRLSLERSTSARGAVSAAYIGSVGRNLLGNQVYVEPGTGILDRRATVTASSSSYEAAQFRYTGTFGAKFYGSASYTWAHSIDDGSADSSLFLIHPGYHPSEARGSSSFDVRHEVALALSYKVPRVGLPIGLRDWTLSGIFRWRTGFPIDVLTTEPPLGQGFDNAGRPDLVPGVPLWLADPTVAGHRRLNPAAFQTPADGLTGSLGRNAFAGNPLAQLDFSMRREFPVWRGLSVQVSVNLYNVTNHPAFANPVPYLASPWFGQSTSMQNLMLGSGTPNTGLPPLFQSGGPRTGELNLRFSW